MVGVYGREEAEAWGGIVSRSVLDVRFFSDGWNRDIADVVGN